MRSNLNMLPTLPVRSGGFRDYDKDCPITVFGSTQARLVGQSLIAVKYTLKSRSHEFLSILHSNSNKDVISAPLFALTTVCLVCFTGEALLESNTVVDFVYCSPSLRCVQTAHNILRGKKKAPSSPFHLSFVSS